MDQKVPLVVPRVRDHRRGQEIPLETYMRLQEPRQGDAGLLRRVLLGLSTRRYQECVEAVPEAFGLSPDGPPPLHPGQRPAAPAAGRVPVGSP